MKILARLAAASLLLAGVFLAALPGRGGSAPATAPWTFNADFAHGLNGWMSFPLPQDIGFDPTLYTNEEGPRTVLVRQVQAHGQKRLQLGAVRPISFYAGPATAIHIEYTFSVAGDLASIEAILAGADGRRYSAPLPQEPGSHAVTVSAAQLRLPPDGVEIQAVLLLGAIEHPSQDGKQKLTISGFTIHAGQIPRVAVLTPSLECTEVGEECISRQVLNAGSALNLKLGQSDVPATLELENPAGRQAREITIHTATNAAAQTLPGDEPAPGLWTARLASGPARTKFNFLVLGAPPPHPRILLRQSRLDQLRTLPQYAPLRSQIHQRAEVDSAQIAYNPAAGMNVTHLPGGTGLYPGFVGELRSYFKLLESYANTIAYCALDYSLNGNEQSFDSARRALLTVARWQTWTPPRFSTHGLHTYYEVGVFAQRVALGYDLIAPRLTKEEKSRVADAFWEQIIEPTVQEYFLYNRMPTAGSNWMANSLGGAIAAAVADEDDVPGWKSREGVALAELDDAFEHLLNGLFPGDGSEVEPAGYENFAMQGISWGMAALDSLGIRPRGTRRMWDGFWWPYYAMVRPDLVLDTGDFDGQLINLSGFAWGAEHSGIPALRDFYDRSASHLLLGAVAGVQHTGRGLEDEAGPLDMACCSGPPQDYQRPPLSRIFPDRGSAVLRSGWEPQATVISVRTGPWFNHEHHDEGSFQAAAFGEKLISEAGYSAYYDDPNYPVYFTQASGHNTVLIDDDPFSQVDYNGNFWRAFDQHPRFTSSLLSPSFDYLDADLTSAYAGRLRRYHRDYVFIPPDFLVVFDRIASSTPHVYSWLLHTPTGADLSTKSANAVIQMPAAAASLLAVAPAANWKIRSTPLSITAFDDLDHGELHTPREFYLHSSEERDARFLVGLHFKPGRADDQTVTMRPISLPAGEGIQVEGPTPSDVVFRTGTGRLQLDGLSTDGTILAVRGKGEIRTWLAAGARVVEQGGTALFRSDSPLAVTYHRKTRGIELSLHSASTADLEVASAAAPSAVRMDGSPAAFAYHAGMVLIRGVKNGDHRVSIDE